MEKDILKGLLAGMVGGVAASGAKALAEKPFSPRPESKDSPPVVLVEKLADRALSGREKKTAETFIHWTFGTLVGGVYGVLVELEPRTASGLGTMFGAALWASTHATTLPALGLDAPPTELPVGRQANELFTHLIYGLSLELARRTVRPQL